MVRDSRGRIYTAPYFNRSSVLIFDSVGHFVKSIGQKGDGPGEYRMIQGLQVGPEDTLYVFDLTRCVVLSPGLTLVRTYTPLPVRMTFPDGALMITPSAAIINGIRRTEDGFGLPYHYVDFAASTVSSFGEDPGMVTTYSIDRVVARVIAPSARLGRMWAGFPGRYVLQRWNVLTGSKEVEWYRRVEWFPESTDPGVAYSPDRPPQAVLLDLREASPGRIWTLTAIADANWKEHLRRRVGPDGSFYGPTSYTGFYDTMVELIDVLTGRVVATRRFDVFLRGFVDDNHVYSIETNDDGVAQNDIWTITLTTH